MQLSRASRPRLTQFRGSICEVLARSLVLVAASCCSLGLDTVRGQSPSAQPNMVVFLVDDMGMMDTSLPFLTDVSGQPQRFPLNDYYRTPSMEKLAKGGIRFNQFYAMSVCSPTRISIMTGHNAARHHTTNWIAPDKNNRGPHGPQAWNWEGLQRTDLTLPRQLKVAGYRTIHVGKGHFGPRAFEGGEPLNLGFDINIAGASFGAPGSYYAEKNYGEATNHAVPHLDKYHGTDTFLSEALTIEAKAAVTATAQSGQPFYLYFAHYAVHAPFDSDPRFAAHYANSEKDARAQAFATLIEGMDKSLGDMLAHFDKLGIAEDTLIFFLGDNGSDAPLGHEHAVACAAPLRGKKGSHYEGGMRVPFIAAWAKPNPENRFQKRLTIPAGAIQPQVASVVDLFPTVLSVAGAMPPQSHQLDGSKLDVLLSGKSDPSRDEIFLMHYPHSPHRSDYFTVYRHGDWKVIYHFYPSSASEGSHYQLYNLAEDPFESTNLATQDPQRLRVMVEELSAALKANDAQLPQSLDGKSELEVEIP